MSGFRPRFFVLLGSDAGEPAARAGAAEGRSHDLIDAVLALDAEDSYHALRVLRLRPGDECEVVVGAAVYAATVLPASAGREGEAVQVRLGERLEGLQVGASYRQAVALVQALVRPSALDWSIEKSTEAGASLILLVQAAGSPRPAGKESAARRGRWARIAREAAKQSKQPAVPPVEIEPSFAAALERLRGLGLMLGRARPPGRTDVVRSRGFRSSGGRVRNARVGRRWPGAAWPCGWAPKAAGLRTNGRTPAGGRGNGQTRPRGAAHRDRRAVAVAVARLALGDW